MDSGEEDMALLPKSTGFVVEKPKKNKKEKREKKEAKKAKKDAKKMKKMKKENKKCVDFGVILAQTPLHNPPKAAPAIHGKILFVLVVLVWWSTG